MFYYITLFLFYQKHTLKRDELNININIYYNYRFFIILYYKKINSTNIYLFNLIMKQRLKSINFVDKHKTKSAFIFIVCHVCIIM